MRVIEVKNGGLSHYGTFCDLELPHKNEPHLDTVMEPLCLKTIKEKLYSTKLTEIHMDIIMNYCINEKYRETACL